MPILDLGKLRFHFAGEWSVSTQYEVNDIVRYGGNVYVYTYALKSAGTLPTDTTRWALMIEGFKFVGVFDPELDYFIGDGVAHGGKVYISIKDSNGATPPNTEYWSQFADGIQYEGEYSNVASYQKNDIVTYGGSTYIATQDTTNNLPTDDAYWDRFVEGVSASSVYNEATSYVPNDLVAYGANIYKAIDNTIGNVPTNEIYWEKFLGGFVFKGEWATLAEYFIGEVVRYGGNSYIALVTHASETFAGDLAGGKWEKYNSGIQYRSEWLAETFYRVDDVVKDGISTYICLEDHESVEFNQDLIDERWEFFARGSDDVLPIRPPEGAGMGLSIALDGINYEWLNHSGSEYVWYVAPHGVDDEVSGKSLATPFASLKYACEKAAEQVTLEGNPLSTIFVKTGTYYEQLPIIVPPNTAIYGDNQRSTTIRPKAGEASDWKEIFFQDSVNEFMILDTIEGQTTSARGKIMHIDQINGHLYYLPIESEGNVIIEFSSGETITTMSESASATISSVNVLLNENAFMFLMSNGTLFQFANLKGMTGWVPGLLESDITTSIVKGVGFTLNPDSPIITASPYILDSSAFFNGGIGGYVDGKNQSAGNKSMLFHAFTNLNNDGLGYWVRHGAIAELVSCFTYYCWIGYSSTQGGTVRSLNGSNSWGTYGVMARGYLGTETPQYGNIYGSMLTITVIEGAIDIGEKISGGTSGASGTVTNVQIAAGKIYFVYDPGSPLFVLNELITGQTSGGFTYTVNNSDAEGGQTGALLIVNGLAEEPRPGGSIEFDGIETAYVIQNVSGTFIDSSSVMIITLAQECPDRIVDGTQIIIRYRYSQVRLTGHDLLNVGTGGIVTTNLPNAPLQPPAQGNETIQVYPGRVYYVTTDQSGNFRVGEFFAIDQGTGRATLNASAFDLSGLTSLRLGAIGAQLGEIISEFSSDITLAGDSNSAVPTEHAVLQYTQQIYTGSPYITTLGNISSLGVGTDPSGTTGEIRATNQITAFYSDKRLKENITLIENALEKVKRLRGVTYNANDVAASFGYTDKKQQVGVIAQEVMEVQPEAVKPAPFDIIRNEDGIEVSKTGENYMTVQYEKLVPILIEAVKELSLRVDELSK